MGLEPNKKKANRWLVAAVQGNIIINDSVGDSNCRMRTGTVLRPVGLEYGTLKPMSESRLNLIRKTYPLISTGRHLTPIFDSRDCYAPMPPSLAAEHYEQSGRSAAP